jgi:hypothetical protein
MKRDMDTIRDILLEIESDKQFFSILTEDEAKILEVYDCEIVSPEQSKIIEHHLKLLDDASLIKGLCHRGGGYNVERLTMKGHNFLDDIRDPKIWKNTKSIAQKTGSYSISVIMEIAKNLAITTAKSYLEI